MCSQSSNDVLSYTWSISEDGSSINTTAINTSLAKYNVVSERQLDITFDNVSKSDGGLYRCIYHTGSVQPSESEELCVYIYGNEYYYVVVTHAFMIKVIIILSVMEAYCTCNTCTLAEIAVFAYCPHELNGCTEEVSLSVTAGESVVFDATVAYTPGGSCDFQQQITGIQLKRADSQTFLYSCSYSDNSKECQMNNNRVILSDSTDVRYLFTMSNTTESDSGVYNVIAFRHDPSSGGSYDDLMRSFFLQVNSSEKQNSCVFALLLLVYHSQGNNVEH